MCYISEQSPDILTRISKARARHCALHVLHVQSPLTLCAIFWSKFQIPQDECPKARPGHFVQHNHAFLAFISSFTLISKFRSSDDERKRRDPFTASHIRMHCKRTSRYIIDHVPDLLTTNIEKRVPLIVSNVNNISIIPLAASLHTFDQ